MISLETEMINLETEMFNLETEMDYWGDDCDDYSRCVAYVDFKDLIDNIRSKYTHLNPKDGKLFQHV